MKHRYLLIPFLLIAATTANAGERKDRATAAGVLWATCVKEKSQRFASQAEPAETLVTAAMGLCIDYAANFRHLLREATREYGLPFTRPADGDSIDRMFAQVEAQIRNLGVASVIQARAK